MLYSSGAFLSYSRISFTALAYVCSLWYRMYGNRQGDSSLDFCHSVHVSEQFSSRLVKVAGLRKDAGDARAYSFLQMLEMLPQMKFPPNYILVENVVGFEVSIESH